MSYVDGFVTPVPAANKAAYLTHVRETAHLFKEHGAVSVVECWGDDVPQGKYTSMPMAVKLEAHEVVVFSWITWPSRAVRDAGWEKIMADPRMKELEATMPYDGKRLIYGGFEMLVNV